jgi:hypothetical protein
MIAQLIFNLPEDQYDFDIMSNANHLYSTIKEFKEYLRNEIKYQDDNYKDEELELLKKIREEFNGVCIDNKVDNLFD